MFPPRGSDEGRIQLKCVCSLCQIESVTTYSFQMSTISPVCVYVDTYKMPSKQKTQVPSTPAATTTPAPCCLLLNRGHILVLLASLRLRPSSPSPRPPLHKNTQRYLAAIFSSRAAFVVCVVRFGRCAMCCVGLSGGLRGFQAVRGRGIAGHLFICHVDRPIWAGWHVDGQ